MLFSGKNQNNMMPERSVHLGIEEKLE